MMAHFRAATSGLSKCGAPRPALWARAASALRASRTVRASRAARARRAFEGRALTTPAPPPPPPARTTVARQAERSGPRPLGEVYSDYESSLRELGSSLLDVESLLVCSLSAVTVAACHLNNVASGSEGLNANPNGGFLSFAVVFPLTFSLSEAFRRRERALRALSQLRAALQSVLQGTRDWDWPPVGGHAAGAAGSRMVGGRNALPPTFVEVTRRELLALVDMQAAFLLRPINNRTRHRRGGAGAPSDAFSVEAVRALDDGIRGSFDRLSRAVEVMKAAGLPGNEASRLRQFTAAALADWELLRALKMYRTPLSIRAFSRIYTLLHPFFMGPYYAYVAGTVSNDLHVSLVFALSLGCATSLCLSALFSARYRLEDPFAPGEMDTVDVQSEFERLRDAFQAPGLSD